MTRKEAAEVYRGAAERVVVWDPEPLGSTRFACWAILLEVFGVEDRGEVPDECKIIGVKDPHPLVKRFVDAFGKACAAEKWYEADERPGAPIIALLFAAEMVETGDA